MKKKESDSVDEDLESNLPPTAPESPKPGLEDLKHAVKDYEESLHAELQEKVNVQDKSGEVYTRGEIASIEWVLNTIDALSK